MITGLVALAKNLRNWHSPESEELLLTEFGPVELRPIDEFRKLEELVGDIDRLYEILDGKSSIALSVDGNSEMIIVHNTERDEFCYNAVRKAIEDSIAHLTRKVAELGYCYSRKV